MHVSANWTRPAFIRLPLGEAEIPFTEFRVGVLRREGSPPCSQAHRPLQGEANGFRDSL
jgi:hypothetical protein